MEAERLQRLVDVGRSVLSELDLEAVLARVLDVARELTDAKYAALGILDEQRKELDRFLTRGIDDETHRRIGDLPRGRGVLGILIDDPRPLRLGDVGAHARSYGFPDGHPPMRTFLGVPILIRGQAYGNLYLTEKNGGEFTAGDEEAVVVLAEWAAIAIEHARLYKGERVRRQDLERAVWGLEATTEIARAVGAETDLDRVLQLIVKRGRAFMEARGMIILLRDGSELVVVASSGAVSPELISTTIPIEGSVGGSVLRSGRAQRLNEIGGHLGFVLGDLVEARTGLFVPLLFRRRSLGVLAAFDRLVGGPEFDAKDEEAMLSFAASAATAVATAQQVEARTLRRSIEVSERERQRWARELHDQTLQDLAALKVALAAARRSGDQQAIEQAVDRAAEQLDQGIRELRALITDLRPAALDELGSRAAIEALAGRVESTSNLMVKLEIRLAVGAHGIEARHDPELEVTMYRVVQEALTNVAKHAEAKSAHVAILEDDQSLTVMIADDGHGYDLDHPAAGFGLLGMRERVTVLGGTLEIRSTARGGTTITATLPVRRAPEPDQSREPVTLE